MAVKHGYHPPLRWTKTPPTEPGWYWHRGSLGDVDIVELRPAPCSRRMVAWWPEGQDAYADSLVSDEWAGPIAMPEEG